MANRTTFTRASATGNLQSLVTNYNANLDALEVELENSLSRKDNILPNSMEDELDMNGNDIINVNEIGVAALTINGTPVQPFAGVTVASAFQSYTFTATLGQTSFSVAPYTAYVASVQVEVNGLALPPADISVSGTNVIIPACTAGDEVVIRRYTSAPSPFPSASDITFNQAGTVNTRSVQNKLRDVVSVKDFGAVGDGVADDTAEIQLAINYCLTTGAGLHFPDGIYRTTSALVIDKSASSLDPTDGGKMLSLRGSGPASCQISADHNGVCLDFTGGSGAGWHTYFFIDGLGITKSNKGRNVGSIGLSLDDCAFAQFQRFDISYFEYGIYGEDVLSSSFVDGTIRLNNYGWRFARGARSHPNNISFRGCVTLNNQIWGGQLIQPSAFNYIGGSVESNGYTGTPGDANSWGVDIQNGGTEGSVAVNFVGVYIENNNGSADIKILSDTQAAVYNFNGCSFLRFSAIASRYATNNIFFNSITNSRLVVSGCGFKDFAPYTSSGAREFIAANDAQVIDGGGNVFLDTSGGNVGINRACFAPIGTNHALPFTSLPDVVKYRNGIQYTTDGGGGTARPSLAVSDGAKWWQIVLGQFGGSVQSSGTANTLPRGWSVTKPSTGIYTVTHNLNISGAQYSVTASPAGAPNSGYCSGMAKSNNSFEFYMANSSGAAVDCAFDFNLSVI